MFFKGNKSLWTIFGSFYMSISHFITTFWVKRTFKVEGKAEHLWKKGELDAENYFTLENSGVPKFLTAISERSLEIKGNINMRWILLFDYLLIIYHVDFLHTDHDDRFFAEICEEEKEINKYK